MSICRIPSLTEDAWATKPEPRHRCVTCRYNRRWESLSLAPCVVQEYCHKHDAPCEQFGHFCGAWVNREVS